MTAPLFIRTLLLCGISLTGALLIVSINQDDDHSDDDHSDEDGDNYYFWG